jgi:hypothetical protein
MHRGARQQRRVDLERRVLGGGADEGEQARFDMRQEGVLLGLVEAVHLVDEDQRAAARCRAALRGASTASRMSFTPASTADSTMNCASTACASSRASVVLPTPGGPHRIIECTRPDSNAARSGRPGPSRCCWPITSASVCGRRRSASGAPGTGRPPCQRAPGTGAGANSESCASACARLSQPAQRLETAGRSGPLFGMHGCESPTLRQQPGRRGACPPPRTVHTTGRP